MKEKILDFMRVSSDCDFPVANNACKSQIRVLYFVDPVIGNGDPDFRLPTLKHHLPVWINAIKQGDLSEKIDFRILTSDYLNKRMIEDGFGHDWKVARISHREIRDIVNGDVKVAERLSEGSEFVNEFVALKRLILGAVEGFDPDVIIVYESVAPYLSKIFPKAKIVNEYWGVFSRAPMPALTTFDFDGIYKKSALFKYKDEIRDFQICDENRDLMNEIRSIVAESLFAFDPCYDAVLASKSEFKKIVLLPLQIDNYFAFTECSNYNTHEELVEAVFDALPSDYGVIVTQHQDHQKVLSQHKIDYFRDKHRNFIYYDDLENVPMLSNFLLNYVDAVLATSTAIGFHASLMKVPLFVLGESQLSVVSSGGLGDVHSFLSDNSFVDNDNILYWIFTHYQYSLDFEQKNYFSLASLIDKMAEARDFGFFSYKRRFCDQEVLDLFRKGMRSQSLESIFKEKGIFFKKNELYLKVCQAKAVSFDLFDTLVERPFIEPHYLFQLIEPQVRRYLGMATFQFMRFRRMAEEAARKARGGKETTLTEIYRYFSKLTGLPRDQCDAIASLEFLAEKSVLRKRFVYYHVYEFSKRLGKVTSIITDIYLEEHHIIELLDRVGIFDYNHLLVSATEDKRKHDGTLYPHYISLIYDLYRFKPDGKSLLHIGDNSHADCNMAMPFGIRCHVIRKSVDELKDSLWVGIFRDNFKKRYMISDVLVGSIANRFSASLAGRNKDSLFGDSLFRVGYAAAGPMLFSFVQWLISAVRKKKYKKIFFLARDGYLLKNIYDKIYDSGVYEDLPESGYLYVSRRCAAVASIYSWHDIIDLYHLSFGNRKIGDFIESRFGLEKRHISKHILREHGYSINDVIYQYVDVSRHINLLSDLKGSILDNAKAERDALVRYFSDNGLHNSLEDVCIVDIGYSGSIQKYMNKIFGEGRISGYYMLTHEGARRSFDDVECEGFYKAFDEQRMADCHPLNDYVFLFESVLSSSEGSVVKHVYDENIWKMVTKGSEKEEARLKFMMHVHAGVNSFAEDFINVVGQFLDDVPLGQYLGSKPFFSLAMKPSPRDAALFKGLVVENGFGGGDAWLLYDPKHFMIGRKNLDEKAINVAVGNSQWKEAARAIYLKQGDFDASPSIVSQPYFSISKAISNNSARRITEDLVGGDVGFKLKDLNLPGPVKKYLKFKKNPYNFFLDSKSFFVRSIRVFYLKYKNI